jgi:cell division protein FtsQ
MTEIRSCQRSPMPHAGHDFKRNGAMDGRERPAQSLMPKAARRAPRPRARAWSFTLTRWRRIGQRFLAPIIALDPPRGAGASAAALLLLASTCYGVVKGGHSETIAAQVQDICDTAANSVGFRISEIALAGQHEVSRESILSLAGITGRSSLLFLDAARTRARLLTDPWIADATVLKLYPGRLRIGITERKPFALWQKDGQVSLIATDGTVLAPYVPARFSSLPLLVGRGAEHAGHAFLDLLNRQPVIVRLVEASVLIAERRWSLHLKSGIEVLLPENDPERALQTLAKLNRTKKLLSRDIITVDLRLADRVTVRLSDAAAAARAEALKAAEKDKKAKRKGGEA